MPYDRNKAIAYAHQWAYKRNPAYYDFSRLGGDCTNFISQCLHAGGARMNYTKNTGWYYSSLKNRAPAWTGVQFLYQFLIRNKGAGPYATEQPLTSAVPGDIIQLNFNGNSYSHTLLIVSTEPQILIATHTDDFDYRPLNTYNYYKARLLHIEGVR